MELINKNKMMIVASLAAASSLILLTGNSVAEDKAKEVFDKVGSFANNTVDTVDGKNSSLSLKADILDPPPGPFIKEKAKKQSKVDIPKTPMIPKGPEITSKTIELKANSVVFDMAAPTLKNEGGQKPPLMAELAKKVTAPVLKNSPPKQLRNNVVAPVAPKKIIKKPKMPPKEIPIWVKQANTANQNNYSINNGMNQNGAQGHRTMPYMQWTNPAQQYIYIPVPMLMPTVAPQMPLAPSFNYGTPKLFNENINQSNDKQVSPEYKEEAK